MGCYGVAILASGLWLRDDTVGIVGAWVLLHPTWEVLLHGLQPETPVHKDLAWAGLILIGLSAWFAMWHPGRYWVAMLSLGAAGVLLAGLAYCFERCKPPATV